MSFVVRLTEQAAEDLERLYAFTVKNDCAAADRALDTIAKAWELLKEFPFSCRKAESADPFVRELVIPFASGGYVALFEIESDSVVTLLAVRHQLEDDYH